MTYHLLFNSTNNVCEVGECVKIESVFELDYHAYEMNYWLIPYEPKLSSKKDWNYRFIVELNISFYALESLFFICV